MEIFSKALFDLGRPDEIPAVPKYVQEWESPFGAEAERFPLQAIGSHSLEPGALDAREQRLAPGGVPAAGLRESGGRRGRAGIEDGDPVRVFNDRGRLVLPCRVTNRILPGVIDIPQGAWWAPDADGTDRGGTVNVLTSERLTPLAHGPAPHTCMVEVEREG